MKKVLFSVFLTFALVLSHQDVHKRGGGPSNPAQDEVTQRSTRQALKDLMTNQKPITDPEDQLQLVSPYCKQDMARNRDMTNPKNGIRFDFDQTTCYAIGKTSNSAVHVLSKSQDQIDLEEIPHGSQHCLMPLEFQAVFLPFAENGDTYMILNPVIAPWFFTEDLGGCDIFVATDPNQGSKPLVIHSNRNRCGPGVLNLQLKGKSADQLLASGANANYNLIARAYFKPTDTDEMQTIEQHIQEYTQNHEGIRLVTYNNCEGIQDGQLFSFIGQYNTRENSWRFILKGKRNGQISGEFKVSAEGKTS